MHTHLAPEYQHQTDAQEAQAIVGKCVHCGFCNATCPTYQVLGDELDSPRGRIYLIKQMLEGQAVSASTQLHLDRCLTCRACETTCPSGVEYGRLIDWGRQAIDEKIGRPLPERIRRFLLREGLPSPLLKPALAMGRWFKRALPANWADHIPPAAPASAHRWPQTTHTRKVVLLRGCVQPQTHPNIDSATARVLDRLGVQCLVADDGGCCGSLRLHNGSPGGALADMRRNVDAWFPLIDRGEVEAVVINASGCGITVKEYAHHLAQDAAYAERARRVSESAMDLGQWMARQLGDLPPLKIPASQRRVAWQAPCSLQHGQKQDQAVETVLTALGFDVLRPADAHLCCGSAGTYSLLQPELSQTLKARKTQALSDTGASAWLSANVGCIAQLQSASGPWVGHWIEWVDRVMHPETSAPRRLAVRD